MRWTDIWVYNPMGWDAWPYRILVKIKIEPDYRNTLWVWEV